VCISWKIKCWILLMHGVNMKFMKVSPHIFGSSVLRVNFLHVNFLVPRIFRWLLEFWKI